MCVQSIAGATRVRYRFHVMCRTALIALPVAAALSLTGCDAASEITETPEPPAAFPALLIVSPDSVLFEALGDTLAVEAEVFDDGGRSLGAADVAWSVADSAVAGVDGGGRTAARGNGVTVVRAVHPEGLIDSTTVVVRQRPTRVDIEHAGGPVTQVSFASTGEELQLVSAAFDARGNHVADASPGWSSSDASVATVDSSGVVTAVAAGSAVIEARIDELSARVTAVVSPVAAEVRLSHGALAFHALLQHGIVRAQVFDSAGAEIEGAAPIWEVEDPDIASVDSIGTVRALANGTTHVMASAGPASASVSVSVVQKAARIEVLPALDTLLSLRDTLQFQARVLDSLGSPVPDSTVEWSATDLSQFEALVVSAEGRAWSVARGAGGEGRVRATQGSLSGSAHVLVTPPHPVLGALVSDTARAQPAVPFEVQIVDHLGQPQAGVDVNFLIPWDDREYDPVADRQVAPAYMRAPGAGTFEMGVVRTTDANGRASIELLYDSIAGTHQIQVHALDWSFWDYLPYEVRPGQPAQLDVLPSDTVVERNVPTQMRAQVTDRFGNVTTAPLLWGVTDAHASIDGSGVVTGLQLGKTALWAQFQSGPLHVSDTSEFYVVPYAEVVFNDDARIHVLSGGQAGALPERPLAPSWSPDGSRIVHVGGGGLRISHVNGTVTQIPLDSLHSGSTWPEWGLDGRIYFYGAVPTLSGQIWRVNPDGSGLERLTDTGRISTPSPDGTKVAYVTATEIRVRDLATGNEVSIGNVLADRAIRWSPDGQWIAWGPSTGGFILSSPDGSVQRQIGTPPHNGTHAYFDWSPDSRWIITGNTLYDTVESWSHASSYRGSAWRP